MNKLIKIYIICTLLIFLDCSFASINIENAVIFSETSNIKVVSSNLSTVILTLSGHTGGIEWLKLLPDGRLASASDDMTVRIWNLTNGTLDMTLYGHTNKAYSIDVLANGYLVSGGYDYALRVWNTTTGSLVMNITNAHSGNILVVKTINQCYFATGSSDNIIKIWDSGTLTCVRNLTGHTGSVYAIESLSDGTIVSGGGDNQAIIWNLTSGAMLASFNPLTYTIYAIREISPQIIAICGYTSKVVFYKVNCSTVPILIKSITTSASYSYFSMIVTTGQIDGYNTSLLYVSCSYSYAMSFNITNLNNITLLKTVKIDSSNSGLYAIEKTLTTPIKSATSCPDLTTATSSSYTSQSSTEVTTTKSTTTTTYSPTNTNPSIILGLSNNNIKVMWSNLTSTIKTLSGHTAGIRSLKILPCDGRLASASDDMTVRIWNLTNGTLDMTLYGHTAGVYSMDVLANGYLVSGGNCLLLFWNTTSGSLVMNITNAHSGNILVVKTINQCYFATGSSDNTIKIWDSNNFTCLRTLKAHTSLVYTIELLSDGTIVSGGGDNQAIIWNLTSGANLTSFSPLNTTIYVIKEISPQVIAVGGYSNAVVFYRVNGSMTPVLIKSIIFSPSITFSFSMVFATISYGSFSSKILYFIGSPYAGSINITDLTNITALTSISNAGYAIEKSVYEPTSTTCSVISPTVTTTTRPSTTTVSTSTKPTSFYTILPLQDMSYMADNMIDSMQQNSVLRCGLLCTSNSICHVFVYAKSNQNCSLYKQSPSEFVPSLTSMLYIRN